MKIAVAQRLAPYATPMLHSTAATPCAPTTPDLNVTMASGCDGGVLSYHHIAEACASHG